ncbi:MAG: adenylate kinase family protein [Methermicoccaceae archaeon]
MSTKALSSMILGISGTPGVGKTTASHILERMGERVLDINALVLSQGFSLGLDDEGCAVADIPALREHLSTLGADGMLVVEGHLAHLVADVCIVVRCSPWIIEQRLRRRGYPEHKVRENAQAEALDVILVEAVEGCKRVYEIDATHLTPAQLASRLASIIGAEREGTPVEGFEYGKVDFTAYLL